MIVSIDFKDEVGYFKGLHQTVKSNLCSPVRTAKALQ